MFETLFIVMLVGAPELRCVNEGYVGSAVAVELEGNDKWAITAKHCIKKPKGKIELHCFEDGVYYTCKARVYCVSESHDVCLLEVLECVENSPVSRHRLCVSEGFSGGIVGLC